MKVRYNFCKLIGIVKFFFSLEHRKDASIDTFLTLQLGVFIYKVIFLNSGEVFEINIFHSLKKSRVIRFSVLGDTSLTE